MSDPVVLIGTSGSIVNCNAAATRLFEAGDGISAADQRLRFADAAAERAYSDATLVCGTSDAGGEIHSFVAPRPSGNRPYIVSLRPIPALGGRDNADLPDRRIASVLVGIRDPEIFGGIDPALLAESYELSPAEIDLAVSMHGGATVREIAARRGVAITTVRTQLYALMGKMYVNRQIDLIRLLQQYRSPF